MEEFRSDIATLCVVSAADEQENGYEKENQAVVFGACRGRARIWAHEATL